MSKKRATLEELKDFANKVRKAGGGNPIDALMPAVPTDATQCLVAKNLNFDCAVAGAWDRQNRRQLAYKDGTQMWFMFVDYIARTHGRDPAVNEEKTRRIAKAVEGCRVRKVNDGGNANLLAIQLPRQIGQVAADFDAAEEALGEFEYAVERIGELGSDGKPTTADNAFEFLLREDLKLVKEMIPYIQNAQDEARKLATKINDDGSIVL